MDKLLFAFDSATDLDVDQATPPRHSSLFKNKDQLTKKQQQRRNEILSNRLSKKDQLIASIRGLISEISGDDSDDEKRVKTTHHLQDDESNNIDTSMATDENTIANKCAKPAQDRKFRNKAMLSEWLVDRPVNFESEWVLKPTPVGRRCLVFSRKGETVAYSRTGQFIKALQTALPGGNRFNTSQCRRQYSIVDCIYVQQRNAFYLMDALAWNEHKLYESEASFRFFWLQSRYNENKDKLLTIGTPNEARFYCLNTYSVNDQDIMKALREDTLIKEHVLTLDGLLFFHSRGPYVPGPNPLVLWIKPDMVTRVLDLPSN